MSDDAPPRPAPLRILHVEDNPLVVFRVEQMVEDLGHEPVGSFDSFAALRAAADDLTLDGALIDIDLVDGRTGPAAAEWLHERRIPSIFPTGQADLGADYGRVSRATMIKPIDMEKLRAAEELFRGPRSPDRASAGASATAGSVVATPGRL